MTIKSKMTEKTLNEIGSYNTKFSKNIQRLNMDRIVNLIQQQPGYERYSAALMSIGDTKKFEEFLPAEDRETYSAAFKKYLEEYQEKTNEYFLDKLERIKKPYAKKSLSELDAKKIAGLKYKGAEGPYFATKQSSLGWLSSVDDTPVEHVNFRYVLERLGIPKELLGMSLNSKYYTLISPELGVEDFYRAYTRREILPKNPNLKQYEKHLITLNEHSIGLDDFEKSRRGKIIQGIYERQGQAALTAEPISCRHRFTKFLLEAFR